MSRSERALPHHHFLSIDDIHTFLRSIEPSAGEVIAALLPVVSIRLYAIYSRRIKPLYVTELFPCFSRTISRDGFLGNIQCGRLIVRIVKTLVSDFRRHGTERVDRGQATASVERMMLDIRLGGEEGNRCQPGATLKRIFSKGCHILGNGDGSEGGTTGERTFSNAGHTLGNADSCQAAATIERGVSYARYAFGQTDGCQVGAAGKCAAYVSSGLIPFKRE